MLFFFRLHKTLYFDEFECSKITSRFQYSITIELAYTR